MAAGAAAASGCVIGICSVDTAVVAGCVQLSAQHKMSRILGCIVEETQVEGCFVYNAETEEK